MVAPVSLNCKVDCLVESKVWPSCLPDNPFDLLEFEKYQEVVQYFDETVGDFDTLFKWFEDRNFDLNAANQEGNTLLHLSAKLGCLSLVQYLISRTQPLELLKDESKLSRLEGFLKTSQFPVTLDKEYSSRDNCIYPKWNVLTDFKLSNGGVVKKTAEGSYWRKTLEKETLLHLASQEGHFFVVQELVKNKADLFAVNSKGQTPLFLAMREKHLSKDVLKKRTLSSIVDYLKLSVKEAQFPCPSSVKERELTLSHQYGRTEEHLSIQELIGWFQEVKPDPFLLLKEVCLRDYVLDEPPNLQSISLLQYVLAHNDVNCLSEDGETVLHKVCSSRAWIHSEVHKTIKKNLIEFLVYSGVDVNIQDKKGRTALHRTYDDLDAIKFVVENGFDLSIRDLEGYSLIEVAVDNCRKEILDYLAPLVKKRMAEKGYPLVVDISQFKGCSKDYSKENLKRNQIAFVDKSECVIS